MRFVYIQQLWLEIIDYLFVGILGDEVWGKFDNAISNNEFNARKKDPKYMDDGDSEELEQTMETATAKARSFLSDAAPGINFLRLQINIKQPTLLLPVHYRSPHFVQLKIDNLTISNYFNGEIETFRKMDVMQWYNNLNIVGDHIIIKNHNGRKLSLDSGVGLEVNVKWPMGEADHAQQLVPRWKINCAINDAVLTLPKDSYDLCVLMIWNNILGETRGLQEFIERRARQPPADEVSVCYNYDIKDGTPTTYWFGISIRDLQLGFENNSNEPVGEITTEDFLWSYCKMWKKSEGFVTKQVLEMGSIVLRQTSEDTQFSAFRELLLPLSKARKSSKTASTTAATPTTTTTSMTATEELFPNLLYTSTSKPNGSNVKLLQITNSCIYFVHPSWLRIKNFFSKIPHPQVYTPGEITIVA